MPQAAASIIVLPNGSGLDDRLKTIADILYMLAISFLATQNAILLQFIIEAVTLCIIGGIIGVIFGSSLYFLVTVFQDWVFTIPFSAIIGSVIFSGCVGLFFGIWPAKKAAALDPAVALRFE